MQNNWPKALRRTVLLFVLSCLPSVALVAAEVHELHYEIISAAIAHGLGGTGEKVLIDEQSTGLVTTIVDPSAEAAEALESLATTQRALDEWHRVNNDKIQFDRKFTLAGDYELVSAQTRAEIFVERDPQRNWARFKQRFNDVGGILRLSLAGVDEVAQKALLYVEYQCGVHCGSGRLINLDRGIDQRWQVTGGTLLWMAAPE